MDIEQLADRLRVAAYTASEEIAPSWDSLTSSQLARWRAVAAEAMKAAPPAPAPDEARALRERVILAVYGAAKEDRDGMTVANMRSEADWLISYINGQSP
jgi:transposase-like protein